MWGVVAQSPKLGVHDTNTKLFTIILLCTNKNDKFRIKCEISRNPVSNRVYNEFITVASIFVDLQIKAMTPIALC